MSTFNRADILLPEVKDMSKWSVIACDQFTSQPEYWEQTEKLTSGAPSALNLIYPEAYLGEGSQRIDKINAAMTEYLDKGIFREYKNSLIYIERIIDGKVCQGLIGAVDLEDYDYSAGAKSRIRATEGTVMERIPPRVEIRRFAPLELPHIMLLMDDMKKTVIEPLGNAEKTPVYDFELMQGGGHIKGWVLSESAAKAALDSISALAETAEDGLLFAVGDGNHSLATAKVCWEERKKQLSPEKIKTDPARFCLVELVNIHSPALVFEPIHRVAFDCDPNRIKKLLQEKCGGDDFEIGCISAGEESVIGLSNRTSKLAVGVLQQFLDDTGVRVDYIHGEDVVRELAAKPGNIGFLLPKPDKSELFSEVIAGGALPRKTFSMGEANEKRYYIEAKRIR